MNWRLGARTLGKKALMSTLYPLLRPLVEAVIDADTRNIERWRYRQSLAETGRFVEEHLPSIQSLRDPAALLRLAVEHLEEEEGLVCEFGVYTGTSLNQIAALLPQTAVWGFDSFTGLPEDWRDRFPSGTYAVDALPKTRRNARLQVGLFDDTLEPFLREHPDWARLLHIDCDLYSSTKTVLDAFAERIKPGTVLVFDEFFNYPGWQEQEYKAFIEFAARKNLSYEYLGYCRYSEQIALKITG